MAEPVSILIPAYNCAHWVDRAIESALSQTWPNKEVIVFDDASTDGTFDLLKKWNGKVRLERAPSNKGVCALRNALTALSSGAWLLYLDADDELAPNALETKMSYAETADVIYGTIDLYDYRSGEQPQIVRIAPIRTLDPIVAAFEWKYPNTSAMMFRRSAVIDVGGWNERLKNCTDYDLYFRLLLAGKRFVGAQESISIYRFWSETQMVFQNPLRLESSRLEVMWRAVLELDHRNQLTPLIREAFSNAVLLTIRIIYALDRDRALTEHKRLTSWYPKFIPSSKLFPKAFCVGYQLLGFRGAEVLAVATRQIRRSTDKKLLLSAEQGKRMQQF
jgi:glycosyltransferase involved in cell wall biosynthesis